MIRFKGAEARSTRSKALQRGVSLGVLVLVLAGAAAAIAQEVPPEEASQVDDIIVTGFRASLAESLSIKRREVGVVDAISAEDIADFPDLNLAEAIQRIPGVSIDRDAGEGRTLTVRGLSADFTRTRINGMEAQATTGGTDSSGGANRGRGFDFNVFAADLFNEIRIRKTQAAEIEEGSLGATIDLRTSRPFDYDGFTAAGSIQYGYNDLSENWDPRFAALMSDTFADGRIGILGSFAYSERNTLEEGFSSVRWVNATGSGSSGGFCSPVGFAPQNPTNSGSTGSSAANCATGVARPTNTAANVAAFSTANQANVYIPRLPRYGRLVHQQERTGFTGSVQFRPWEGTTISYDLLYSHLEATRQENFLEALSFSRNAAAGGQTQIHVVDAVVENNELVYGVFNNVDLRSEQRYDELITDFTQHTFTVDHNITDRLRMRAFAGIATSDFDNPVQTTVTLDAQNVQNFSWDFRENGNTPLINWGIDPTSAASWQWRAATLGTGVAALPRSEIRLRPNSVDTEFQSAQLDFIYDLNDTFTLRFGANFKSFESRSMEQRRADETLVPVLPAGTTMADITTLLTGFGRNLGLPGGSTTSWIVPNLSRIASVFDIYCNCNTGVTGGDFTLTGVTNGNARNGNRFIDEDDTAFYLQADFETFIADMRLRGNVGVRQVNTQLYAEGYSSTGGGTLVFDTHEYNDTLPSLNLALDVTDELLVRFGAARVMARPSIGNSFAGQNYLVPTTSLNTGPSSFTATIGNVELDPFRANTYDLSIEWYFAPESLLSVAFFYKDIDSYIQVIRQDLEYQELTALNPSAFAAGFCTLATSCSPTTIFQLTSAVNTEGGPLSGFEISYQQPFTFLPGLLANTGVQLNYTQVQSEIDYCTNALCTTSVTNDLVNLSPRAFNATLYYEDETFSARISGSHRDEYLQNVPGRNNNATEGKMDTFTIDASASWNVTDSVQLTFEGLNLTDEANHQWVGDDTRQSTSVYHVTGRQFYFGARYRF